MKKNLITLASILVFIVLGAGQIQAKDFKGVITYKITYPGSDIPDELRSFLPSTMTTYFLGNMSKTEMNMGMGKTIVIKNGDEKSKITLIDMMGHKIAVQSTPEEIATELQEETPGTVEVKSETKEILNYTCKKAVISIEGEEEKDKIIVYFTDELEASGNYFDTPEYKDIDGVMLEFEMLTEEFTMHFTAISVEKQKLNEKDFEIPEGYEVKTEEELEALFGSF